MRRNFFHIEGKVDLADFFNALPFLHKDGVLLLMGIVNDQIIATLREFQIPYNDFPNIGKSITFTFFKQIKEKNLAIEFNDESKKILMKLAKENVPSLEVCSYIYYLTEEKNEIVEFVVDDNIFISRDIVDNDEIIRDFCQKISIDRYCLEEFY